MFILVGEEEVRTCGAWAGRFFLFGGDRLLFLKGMHCIAFA